MRENYRDAKALGSMVLEDLLAVINRVYPEETKPEPLDRDAAEHDSFARSRAGFYIRHAEDFERLDKHVLGDGFPLMILGEAGSGKSALLANWSIQYRREHPQAHVITHFIGATPYSSNIDAMLRRIIGEINRQFGMQQSVPDKPDALRIAFANSLSMTAVRQRLVLIVDGLDQLEARDGLPGLSWLPGKIPANVRLIVSTLAGPLLEDLKERGWPSLVVKSLGLRSRKEFIVGYLGHFGKELPDDIVDLIAMDNESANPLVLRTLLEELRIYGDHSTIERRIAYYLAAPSIPQFFDRILERYEQDYQTDCDGLISNVMSLLCAARRGLSEAELLDLLGTNGEPLPQAYWSPLFLAAEQSLITRSGLIGFFHGYLREAAERRYLSSPEKKSTAQLLIADYFSKQENNARKIDELPWLLAETKSWDRLYNVFSDLAFVHSAYQADQFQLRAYWTRLESESRYRIPDAYRDVLNTPNNYSPDQIRDVKKLLDAFGYRKEAVVLGQARVAQARGSPDSADLLYALGDLAYTLERLGQRQEAIQLYSELEELAQKRGDKSTLAVTYIQQAVIFSRWRQNDKALALYMEAERIATEIGDRLLVEVTHGNRAGILRDMGEYGAAMELHKQEEHYWREIGNKGGLHRCLANQARIYENRGDLQTSLRLLEEGERICREIGAKDGLLYIVGLQSELAEARGDDDEALRLIKEAEQLCRQLDDRRSLAISMHKQALLVSKCGEPLRALKLLHDTEQLCRLGEFVETLIRVLINEAHILAYKLGQPTEALPVIEEAQRLMVQHGLNEGASTAKTILEYALSQQKTPPAPG